MRYSTIALLIVVALVRTPLPAQPSRIIDSLKDIKAVSSAQKIQTAFLIADNYMEIDRYDSAQVWLNRAAELVPLRKPDLSNYLLSSRQAEIYYYNYLHRLGLQEAERSRRIAETLNDSFTLADSYNFIGLFYLNLDSTRRAIVHLNRALGYARGLPFPKDYGELTEPHHIYGNLAEAYEKAGYYDSALYASRRSLAFAQASGATRGVVIAWHSMGTAFLGLQKPDSAHRYFLLAADSARASQQSDVALLAYEGLARAEADQAHPAEAIRWLETGFSLFRSDPGINPFFRSKFVDGALPLLERFGSPEQAARALRIRNELFRQQVQANNQQVTTILDAALLNETRLLQADIREAEQRNEIANFRVYLLLCLILLLAAGFVFYRHRSRQRLQLMQLQYKISQDLHDDVGSSLSSLQVYSSVAGSLLDREPAKAREMLQKITKESTAVMENIGDIVWSMKTETEQSLEERIRNFAADVLGAAGIRYALQVEAETETILRNFEARKNILLIIKEAVNNCVKFSGATFVSIAVKRLAGQLCVQVSDNGIGFTNTGHFEKSKGLYNMRQRTQELQGIFELSSTAGKGTTIAALIPLAKISDHRAQ